MCCYTPLCVVSSTHKFQSCTWRMLHIISSWNTPLLLSNISSLVIMLGNERTIPAISSWNDRLVGLVVKACASGAEGPEFESRLWQDFSRSSHTSDLKIGTPVATLPGAWHYRVNARTGEPGVSILWLGEMESLVCNFYLSVTARKIVCADPSLRVHLHVAGSLNNQQTNNHLEISGFCYLKSPLLLIYHVQDLG